MMNHQSTRIFKLKNLSVAAMFRSAGIGSSPAKWQRSTNFQWQRSTDFQHNGKSVEGIGSRDGLKKMAILNIQGHYGAAITKKECRKSPSHEKSCVGYLGASIATGSMTKLRHLVAIQEGGRGWSKALATTLCHGSHQANFITLSADTLLGRVCAWWDWKHQWVLPHCDLATVPKDYILWA